MKKLTLKSITASLLTLGLIMTTTPSSSAPVIVQCPEVTNMEVVQNTTNFQILQTLKDLEEEQLKTWEAIGIIPLSIDLVGDFKELIEVMEDISSIESSMASEIKEIDSGTGQKIEQYQEKINSGDLGAAITAFLSIYQAPEDESFEDMNKRAVARKAWYSRKVAMQEALAAVCRMNVNPEGVLASVDQNLLISMTQLNREELANNLRKVTLVMLNSCVITQQALALQVDAMDSLENSVARIQNVSE